MILTSNDIETLAIRVLRDYGDDPQYTILIERFAIEYLGLALQFERLSPDLRVLGITTYKETQIRILGWDCRTITVPEKAIIIEKSLLPPRLVLHTDSHRRAKGRLRFTLAHECAHQILYRADPAHFQKMLDKRADRPYFARELKSETDWCEWQANSLASALLMPRQRIADFLGDKKIRVYGNSVHFLDSCVFARLATALDVTYTALLIRLTQLGYTKRIAYSEFVGTKEEYTDEHKNKTPINQAV
ncbi:MAG: ImmA/IrrE family metallo-endopeptidase [Oscillospiraceae bacterium]|jgi:Zn-dependent peptidase ImmA (M78 family)|nr:ImmA/IrrE family metallo-endopeptidase [Oscillospiraceae bacterium]